MDYSEYLETAIIAAKAGGKVIVDAWELPRVFKTKLVEQDLVTLSDVEVEKIVKKILLSKYPHHGFIGEEEASASESSRRSSKYTWIVDPIDGTTNFYHGFPFVCVCIALAIDSKPVVGVVFNPILNELYTGVVGIGSFLNGRSLPLSKRDWQSLAQALVITEFGSDRSIGTTNAKNDTLKDLLIKEKFRGVRCLGSAALNLCNVAKGAADVYYEAGLRVWDIAAAGCILCCAGGSVYNWHPENKNDEIDYFVNSMIGVRPLPNQSQATKIVADIRACLKPINIGRDHKL
ncbi:hypothetical protein SmJEL517_g01004 [Synchytrium microbalum]|uniref:Inositol-1-monophosphatase n=1 Tax=Synchytrium microbalum TaxID=1806994 RepID=A0A507CBU3_9FUNG|nr:uncharacterized protein SmJEL517_g01004 [Synchytrium microbalum]TPX36961.1 hypothetical protein SmJEL517_g01004 [Synchytrium microbalum]